MIVETDELPLIEIRTLAGDLVQEAAPMQSVPPVGNPFTFGGRQLRRLEGEPVLVQRVDELGETADVLVIVGVEVVPPPKWAGCDSMGRKKIAASAA